MEPQESTTPPSIDPSASKLPSTSEQTSNGHPPQSLNFEIKKATQNGTSKDLDHQFQTLSISSNNNSNNESSTSNNNDDEQATDKDLSLGLQSLDLEVLLTNICNLFSDNLSHGWNVRMKALQVLQLKIYQLFPTNNNNQPNGRHNKNNLNGRNPPHSNDSNKKNHLMNGNEEDIVKEQQIFLQFLRNKLQDGLISQV